jgi:Stress responsive A/B Barrel Domain
MFRHVVLFTWTAEATDEQKQAVAAALATLPASIAEIRAFHYGPDAGLKPGNCDFAVVADFDDADGYLAYRDHPAHRDAVERFVNPIAASRAAVQYRPLPVRTPLRAVP